MKTRRTVRTDFQLRIPLVFDRKSHVLKVQAMASSISADGSTSNSAGAISTFAPIPALVLGSIEPIQVMCFLKERESYELEINAKQEEVPSFRALPCTASIDRALLKTLFFMGKFDDIADGASATKGLTDDRIKSYVDYIVYRSSSAYIDPTVIEEALEGFSMPMHIAGSDARITHYCAEFFERLESVRFGNFRDRNQKKAVNILVSLLQPTPLKRDIRRRISYD